MTVALVNDSDTERIGVSASPSSGWAIAPAGHTGRACPNCMKYFTTTELIAMCDITGSVTGVVNCIRCGYRSSPETAHIGVRHDAAPLLEADESRSRIWYHATLLEGWHQKMLGSENLPLVHLGTKEAALARAAHLGSYMSSPVWNVYGVKLVEAAFIAVDVLDDEDDSAPATAVKSRSVRARGYDVRGVTRYVNRYEAEGSISLLANPLAFRVVSRERHN